jgi:hypothetical protein
LVNSSEMMNDVLQHQEELNSMAEELISFLRTTNDIESVHTIKQLQDTLRMQYERYQFEARDLMKSMKRPF